MLDIPHVLLLFAIVLSYFIGITIYSLIAYVASLIYYKSGWFECNVFHFKFRNAWSCYFVPITPSKIVFNKEAMEGHIKIITVLLIWLLSICNVCIVF